MYCHSPIINGTDELLAELREMGVGCYATGGETADEEDAILLKDFICS